MVYQFFSLLLVLSTGHLANGAQFKPMTSEDFIWVTQNVRTMKSILQVSEALGALDQDEKTVLQKYGINGATTLPRMKVVNNRIYLGGSKVWLQVASGKNTGFVINGKSWSQKAGKSGAKNLESLLQWAQTQTLSSKSASLGPVSEILMSSASAQRSRTRKIVDGMGGVALAVISWKYILNAALNKMVTLKKPVRVRLLGGLAIGAVVAMLKLSARIGSGKKLGCRDETLVLIDKDTGTFTPVEFSQNLKSDSPLMKALEATWKGAILPVSLPERLVGRWICKNPKVFESVQQLWEKTKGGTSSEGLPGPGTSQPQQSIQ